MDIEINILKSFSTDVDFASVGPLKTQTGNTIGGLLEIINN